LDGRIWTIRQLHRCQSSSRYIEAAIQDESQNNQIAKITKRPSLPTAAPDEEERRDSILQDEFSFCLARPRPKGACERYQPSLASSAA
jgi:hypothetical protein